MIVDGQRVAVCIPSRGRGARVTKMWHGKMKFLDRAGVYLGVDRQGREDYDLDPAHATLFTFDNKLGSVSYAREQVRQRTLRAKHPYDLYVLTDDNATFTEQSLHNLIRAQVAYQKKVGPKRGVVMAGMHGTAAHFDKNKVENAETVGGWRSYARVSMMYWVIPGTYYRAYRHPDDAYGYDDRHLLLHLIEGGIRHFRICVDAPFAKARYQRGGQGDLTQRIEKNTRGALRLYNDFNLYMGLFDPHIPWTTVLKYADGQLHERLGRNAR